MLNMANWVHKETKKKYLCLAGGVALNCVGNGHILRDGPFEDIWIQPAAGDAGGALGAALAAQFGYHRVIRPPSMDGIDRQKGSYLGPSFSEKEIEAFLEARNLPYVHLKEERAPQSLRLWRRGILLVYSRVVWSTARVHWVLAQFWAIPY